MMAIVSKKIMLKPYCIGNQSCIVIDSCCGLMSLHYLLSGKQWSRSRFKGKKMNVKSMANLSREVMYYLIGERKYLWVVSIEKKYIFFHISAYSETSSFAICVCKILERSYKCHV